MFLSLHILWFCCINRSANSKVNQMNKPMVALLAVSELSSSVPNARTRRAVSVGRRSSAPAAATSRSATTWRRRSTPSFRRCCTHCGRRRRRGPAACPPGSTPSRYCTSTSREWSPTSTSTTAWWSRSAAVDSALPPSRSDPRPLPHPHPPRPSPHPTAASATQFIPVRFRWSADVFASSSRDSRARLV